MFRLLLETKSASRSSNGFRGSFDECGWIMGLAIARGCSRSIGGVQPKSTSGCPPGARQRSQTKAEWSATGVRALQGAAESVRRCPWQANERWDMQTSIDGFSSTYVCLLCMFWLFCGQIRAIMPHGKAPCLTVTTGTIFAPGAVCRLRRLP